MSTVQQQATQQKPWEKVAAAKRAEREALLKQHSSHSRRSNHDTRITDIADVRALTDLIRLARVTAEDVVNAYIDK